MGKTVKVTGSVDDREMLQAWQRQLKLLDRMEKKLDQVGKAGDKSGKRTQSGFKGALTSVAKFAGAIGIVSTALGVARLVASQLRKEVDNIRSRQQDAGAVQVETAIAQKRAMLNLSDDRKQPLVDAVERTQKLTGAKQSVLYDTNSAALSFKGSKLTDEVAYDATLQAARIEPVDGEQQVSLATGFLAQIKKTGGTPAQIAGFQLLVKQASPVTEAGKFAQNIAPGIADLVALGDTPREAGTLLATLGSGMSDKEGSKTRTASTNFALQLKQKLPNVEGGTLGRIEAASQMPKLREELLGSLDKSVKEAIKKGEIGEGGNLTGRAAVLPTLISLLQEDDNEMKQLMRATYQSIPNLVDGAEALNKQLGIISKQPLQQTAGIYNAGVATVDSIKLGDTEGGRTGILRQQLSDVLKASGRSKTEQEISALLFDAKGGLRGDGTQAAVEKLLEVAEDLRDGSTERIFSSVSAGPGAAPSSSLSFVPATPQEKENAAALASLAAEIKNLTKAVEDNTDETDKNTNSKRIPFPPRISPTQMLER